MLRVNIDINGIPLYSMRAIRVVGDTDPDSLGTYETSFWDEDGEHATGELRHRYGDGAVRLAELLAQRVQENLPKRV